MIASPTDVGPDPIRYDVIVVGAGLAGMLAVLSAQHLLASRAPSARLLWLDAGNRAAVSRGSDGRGITMTPGTLAWCETVGICGLREVACPMDSIAVHAGNFSEDPPLVLSASEHNVPALGYVVRADVLFRCLGEAIDRALRVSPWIEACSNTAVVALESLLVGCSVGVSDGRVFHGEVVLVADGKASKTRRLLGVDALRVDYNQSAMIAVVSHEKPHGRVAHESFQPSGPLAILPLPDPCASSLVWTEQSSAAKDVLSSDSTSQERLLTHRFGRILGSCRLMQPMVSHPLVAVMPRRIVEGSVLWMGDAAHTIHPIAGQGWNVGVQDVRAWYELTASVMDHGGALGLVAPLYADNRQSPQWTMFGLTHGLERWFDGYRPLRRALSYAGMLALGHPWMKAVREKIVRYAMQ